MQTYEYQPKSPSHLNKSWKYTCKTIKMYELWYSQPPRCYFILTFTLYWNDYATANTNVDSSAELTLKRYSFIVLYFPYYWLL